MSWKNCSFSFFVLFVGFLGVTSLALAEEAEHTRRSGRYLLQGATAAVDTVFGRVRDAQTSRPLAGVNVRVVGTRRGTATGSRGRYSIAVPEAADSLRFSFIGYETAQVAINGRSEVDVALRPETYVAEELVVVGYGAQERQDLTGAVSSVSPEDLERGPVATVGELLQSKIPGLRAVPSGGQPGSSPAISIRGAGSIGAGTGPLYVVDGLPGAGPPNPADIESIEVLKGPSATAIYGSRGANGVILITTKTGQEGDLRINYTGEVSMATPSNKLDVLTGQEYKNVLNDLIDAGAGDETERVGEITANGGNGTDWQDVIMRSAPAQNHDLSFSGGSAETQYYASLGAFLEEGVVKSSDFQRYQARMNLNHEVTNDFNLGVKLNGFYRKDGYVENNFGVNLNAGAIYSAFNFDPTLPIYNEDGTLYKSRTISVDNPLAKVQGVNREADVYRFFGTAFAEYFFIPSLSAKVRVGADLFSRRQDEYISRVTEIGAGVNGIANIVENRDRDYLIEGTLTYDNRFEDHSLNVLGGFTAQQFINRNFSTHAEDFPSDVTGTDNLGLANPEFNTNNSFKSTNQLLSFISRVNYSFKDRYRLTGTVRVDGSSRFGENNRYGVFPSAALAWNMDQEPFMEQFDFISRLKPRVSWGRTGNQAIGNYESISTFVPGPNVIWNDEQAKTLEPARLANPDLQWETTEQVNVGVDFGLWNDRISGTAEYFWKDTYDMLLALPVPSSTGFLSQLTNIGSIYNAGFELSLTSQNVSTESFGWKTDLNFATLNNEVQDLGPLDEIVTGSAGFTDQISLIRPGLPLRTYYGYDVTGVWQEGDDFGEYDAQPGDLRFRDVNDDGKINPDDRVPLGDAFPDLTGGIGNTFSYKNFNLYVFIEGASGMSMLNNQMVLTYLPTSFRRNRLAEPLLNRWTPENPSDYYPSFVNTDQKVAVSSRTVEDASYLRLQNVRLSYEVPFETNLYRSLTIYALGQNLYTLTEYSGADPAANANNDPNFRIDYNTYPLTRSYTLGVRIGL